MSILLSEVIIAGKVVFVRALVWWLQHMPLFLEVPGLRHTLSRFWVPSICSFSSKSVCGVKPVVKCGEERNWSEPAMVWF